MKLKLVIQISVLANIFKSGGAQECFEIGISMFSYIEVFIIKRVALSLFNSSGLCTGGVVVGNTQG